MLSQNHSIAALLGWARGQLSGGESPAIDARILLMHCLQCDAAYLMTWPEKEVENAVAENFRKLVSERKQGRPVAHLIGYRDFWDLRLTVSPETLIPRPETELLVETALSLALPKDARVLDLGTGTGAIALALARENPDWTVTGVDLQPGAVALAEKNARDNGIDNASFLQSDWFDSVPDTAFDLIISNPPYVEQDSPYLTEGDVRFEPLTALVSGADGLNDIRHISACSLPYLVDTGVIMFEHGFQQAHGVAQILRDNRYTNITTKADLNNLPRLTFAYKSH